MNSAVFAGLAVGCALMRNGSTASFDAAVYTLGFWVYLVLALVSM